MREFQKKKTTVGGRAPKGGGGSQADFDTGRFVVWGGPGGGCDEIKKKGLGKNSLKSGDPCKPAEMLAKQN